MDNAVLLLITFMVVAGYLYIKRKYKYWERKKIAQLEPLPLIGDLLQAFTFKKSMNEIYKEAYYKFPKEKVVGIYEILSPVLVIRDPKLIENIIIKDFQYFMNRAIIATEKNIVTKTLFQMRDKKWKCVRSKISPSFSSSKLKLMFSHMLECTDELVECINKNIKNDYEIKNDLSTFTMDVIGNAILGIQINNTQSMKKLKEIVNSVVEIDTLKYLQILLILNAPKLAELFGLAIVPNKAIQYFRDLIKNTIEQRTKNNIQRNDYIQQLLKLKERGFIEIRGNEEEDEYLNLSGKASSERIEITDELLTGQAMQFIIGGYDLLYLTMLYSMYELARDTQVQERARNEVKEVLKKHGGYTYEAIKEMTYLEQCIQENMRLNLLLPVLFRECTKTYVTDDGLVIEKGHKVIIPLNALHMDPKYYPEPEVFNPERFPPNTSRCNFTYMPFGDGPRMCIGARLSMVEVKLVLAKIIDNFKFTLSQQTKVPLERNNQAHLTYPTSKILLYMTPV